MESQATTLIESSRNVPFTVDVVSLLPKLVHSQLATTTTTRYVTGTTVEGCSSWNIILLESMVVPSVVANEEGTTSTPRKYKLQMWRQMSSSSSGVASTTSTTTFSENRNITAVPPPKQQPQAQQSKNHWWSDMKHKTPVYELYHESLDASTRLVAIASSSSISCTSSSEGGSIPYQHHNPPEITLSVYACTRTTLLLWKVVTRSHGTAAVLIHPPKTMAMTAPQQQEQQPRMRPHCMVPIETGTIMTCMSVIPSFSSSSLQDSNKIKTNTQTTFGTELSSTTLVGATSWNIVLGDHTGQLYRVQQTHVPLGLSLFPIDTIFHPSFFIGNMTSSSSSILSRFSTYFTPKKQKTRHIPSSSSEITTGHYNPSSWEEADSAIVRIVPTTPIAQGGWISIERNGSMTVWNSSHPVEPASSSSAARSSTYFISQQCNLLNLLQQQQEGNANDTTFTDMAELGNMRVLHATMSTRPVTESDTTTTATTASVLHVLCLMDNQNNRDFPMKNKESEREPSRLYWVVMDEIETHNHSRVLRIHSAKWLDRFIAPESTVQIAGLVSTKDGTTYAGFSSSRLAHSDVPAATVVMAMDVHGIPHEVDLTQKLPPFSSILCNTMTPDVVTHGVLMLHSSGLGMRVRYLPQPSPSVWTTSATKTALRGSLSSTSSQPHDHIIHTLAQHLRLTFWNYYSQPDWSGGIHLPPSIGNANSTDAEAAVVLCAKTLSSSVVGPESSTSNNPLHAHLGFVEFLQQAGLYRDLSELCRWNLVSIGQQVCVFQALSRERGSNPWENEWLRKLTCDVPSWLQAVQEDALQGGSSEKHQESWLQWLCLALEAATEFRNERVQTIVSNNDYVVYDLSPSPLPRAPSSEEAPVWTSSSLLRNILWNQMNFWSSRTTSTKLKIIQTVAMFTLQGFEESYVTFPTKETKVAYCEAQQVCFAVLRVISGFPGNEFAFELAIKHHCFSKVCELALLHERRRDREKFSLIPLFPRLELEEDLETGLKFGLYVLKWHTDRKNYGHVFHFGKYCPDALSQLIYSVDALNPHSWIHAVRQGDYSAACDSLCGENETAYRDFAEAKTAFSLASISDCILEQESMILKDGSSKRRRLIEKKRELINAQEELFGSDSSSMHLWPSEKLLNHALRELEIAETKELRIKNALIALAISSSFESDEDLRKAAVRVWSIVILVDEVFWTNCLNDEADFASPELCDVVRENTIFGSLVEQSKGIENWEEVIYSPSMESFVLESLSRLNPRFLTKGMERLLRSVTSKEYDCSGENEENMALSM
jgi:hypothetical protein